MTIASHCPLQKSTAERMAAYLARVPRRAQRVAYLTNTGGRRGAESAAVLDDLAQAVARPVQWYDAMRLMSELGAKRAVQMPPGLEASREYGTEVEWQFSFTVVSPGGTAVDTAR